MSFTDMSMQLSPEDYARLYGYADALREGHSTIYFLQALLPTDQPESPTGLIKIGHVAGPDNETRRSVLIRSQEIQRGSPLPLILLAVQLEREPDITERALHERFSNLRVWGEWFRPEGDLLAYIAQLGSRPHWRVAVPGMP